MPLEADEAAAATADAAAAVAAVEDEKGGDLPEDDEDTAGAVADSMPPSPESWSSGMRWASCKSQRCLTWCTSCYLFIRIFQP